MLTNWLNWGCNSSKNQPKRNETKQGEWIWDAKREEKTTWNFLKQFTKRDFFLERTRGSTNLLRTHTQQYADTLIHIHAVSVTQTLNIESSQHSPYILRESQMFMNRYHNKNSKQITLYINSHFHHRIYWFYIEIVLFCGFWCNFGTF